MAVEVTMGVIRIAIGTMLVMIMVVIMVAITVVTVVTIPMAATKRRTRGFFHLPSPKRTRCKFHLLLSILLKAGLGAPSRCPPSEAGLYENAKKPGKLSILLWERSCWESSKKIIF
eukprot:Rmarinus@m.27099